ncbi:hypothetical protein THC_1557 [Caldimicrobium thiodismutans]|uniref:asparagine synthase (glutamine-hydrolyzing) n=1 Tax=Caldimicrobium thiodismutans TaxID=1653476 RepID=A0A0U5APR3_9BACT|nr:asparagine synthase-related protein [Caldimicrobium thiodismutans]BAU23922.1 hypothetical protein THC_1557 [Caldimicrobium thiodismutans]
MKENPYNFSFAMMETKNSIKIIEKKDLPLTIKGPITAGYPIYFYYLQEKELLLLGEYPKDILSHPFVSKPLKISPLGLTFFLQYGFIPSPFTIFENLYVLSLGDRVEIYEGERGLLLEFKHEFPYFNQKREKNLKPDKNYLLNLIIEAIFKRWDKGSPLFLFQSLGKDSNTIALALSEAGLQEKAIFGTLATEDRKDESKIAEKLAKKLGFRHIKLPVPEKPELKHIEILQKYFANITLPCGDGVSLAYPLYTLTYDFSGHTILDGSGNDVYFGHVPRKVEYTRQNLYTVLSLLKPLSERLPSGNPLQKLSLYRSEYPFYHLLGFTFRDCKKIYPEAERVYPIFKNWEKDRKNWDYFDLKADLWGTHAELSLVTQKVRNFAEAYQLNFIFPWGDEELAKYVGSLPEKYLFDRKTFKNKILLREILKEKLDLDSDALGKFSYGFSAYNFLRGLSFYVEEEIFSCQLWEKGFLKNLWEKIKEKAKNDKFFQKLFVRLFLISAWFNHNIFLKTYSD